MAVLYGLSDKLMHAGVYQDVHMVIFSTHVAQAVMLCLVLYWAGHVAWSEREWTRHKRWNLAAALLCALSIVADWVFNLSTRFLLYYVLVALCAFCMVKLGQRNDSVQR